MIHRENIIQQSAEQIFSEKINIGEKLLWFGQPNPKVHFTPYDKILIPFSILSFGFCIFVFTISLILGAPIISSIFGILFVFLVLNFLYFRFRTKIRRKKLTYYAISNQRVFLLYQGRKQIFKEMKISNINDLIKEVRPDGTGTLIFGKRNKYIFSFYNHLFQNSGLEDIKSYSTLTHFFDIDNANQVYQILQDVMNKKIKSVLLSTDKVPFLSTTLKKS